MSAARKNRKPVFEEGALIVHPHHGGGEVTAIREWEIAGVKQDYYCIKLINEDCLLMIPVQQAKEAGLRRALKRVKSIARVLTGEPEELDPDYRKRQVYIAQKIQNGDPAQLAEVIRDLAWCEHISGCTQRDLKLKSQAESLLISELVLTHDLDDLAEASQYVDTLIQETIAARTPEGEIT